MTDERRQRDISIAKKMRPGREITLIGGDPWIMDEVGNIIGEVRYYSTDPAACVALLVEVHDRGWYTCGLGNGLHKMVSYKFKLCKNVQGESTLTDPALAFADAVSQACEAALEAEGGGI